MVNAHIIQHTHWDREWYFTNEDAIVLSDQVFTEVLDELERNPKVNFCLDGQLQSSMSIWRSIRKSLRLSND